MNEDLTLKIRFLYETTEKNQTLKVHYFYRNFYRYFYHYLYRYFRLLLPLFYRYLYHYLYNTSGGCFGQ